MSILFNYSFFKNWIYLYSNTQIPKQNDRMILSPRKAPLTPIFNIKGIVTTLTFNITDWFCFHVEELPSYPSSVSTDRGRDLA